MKKLLLTCLMLVFSINLAMAETVMGTISVPLHQLTGKSLSGNAAPQYNGKCHHKYQAYKNKKLTLKYSIDKQKNYYKGTITFMNVSTPVNPAGIKGVYAFVSDGPGALKAFNVIEVWAKLSTSLTSMQAGIVFKGGKNFSCSLE